MPRGINTVTQAIFFVDDLWLYYYDRVNYSGVMAEVFRTAQEIQRVKWALIDVSLAFNHIPPALPVPNYSLFSYPRFVAV